MKKLVAGILVGIIILSLLGSFVYVFGTTIFLHLVGGVIVLASILIVIAYLIEVLLR